MRKKVDRRKNLLPPQLLLMLSIMLSGEAVAFAGGLDPFQGVSGSLMIAGGTAHLPFMIEAAQRVHTAYPGIYINVVGGGSSLGIQKVGEGLVHIGNSGRPLSDAERAKYRLVSHPLALDGIAVVVHAGNPVSKLSREQIAGIFSGQICNWQELGGVDAPIMLYGRDQGSATMEVFEQKLLGKDMPLALCKCNRISSNSVMRNIIAMDRNGIGFLSIGFLDWSKVKGISIDGVVPSQQNALNGTYTIARTLFLHTRENPSQLTHLFVEYLKSSEGASMIQEAGYLPLP